MMYSKAYKKPKIEVVVIKDRDVLTSSGVVPPPVTPPTEVIIPVPDHKEYDSGRFNLFDD